MNAPSAVISRPSEAARAASSCKATLAVPSMRRQTPPEYTTSSGPQPSTAAASARSLSRICAAARKTALPPVYTDRDAVHDPESGPSPVSPTKTLTSSTCTSRASAAIWAYVVELPCPISGHERPTVHLPSLSSLMRAAP